MSGVRPGDRIALLVPPGADLAVTVYACLRIGAVIVVADAGLGVAGLHRAIRSALPTYLVGIGNALAAARALGWPGTPIAAGPVPGRRLLGAPLTLAELARRGTGRALPPPPPPGHDAAIVFTSGSTGPAKGVVYTYRQIEAARDMLLAAYPVGPAINAGAPITGTPTIDAQTIGAAVPRVNSLVAAFAPFALFGPALGGTTVVPDCDATAPATLTAAALADSILAADATAVFASPAALANVVRTAAGLDAAQRTALGGVRLLLSAGAPVPVPLLLKVSELMPAAEIHTPYGMTEALPVTDVTLAELVEAGPARGYSPAARSPGSSWPSARLTRPARPPAR